MADDPKRIFGDDIATHSGARLVVRCLRNYPERLHEKFPFLVMDAFRDALQAEITSSREAEQ